MGLFPFTPSLASLRLRLYLCGHYSNQLMQPMQENPQGRRFAIVWISCLAAIVAGREFLPPLLRCDLHDEDFAHHIWWLYHWVDSQLFPDDLAHLFFSQPILAPYGYQFLFRTLVPFVDPLLLAESLPFILVLVATALAFQIGQRVGQGLLGGVVAAVFFILAQLRFLHAGLPRSFATPILLFGMWALLTQRQIALGCALLLAVLFYPPVAANLGLCAAIVLVLRVWKERKLPARWPVLIAIGCLALVVLGLAYLRPMPPGLGQKVTFEQAYAMPEFWSGGRSHFFDHDPWRFYFSKRDGLGINPWLALLLTCLLVVVWRSFPGVIGVESWALAGTALGLFVSAHLTLFVLHHPNRYTLYALPVFGLLVVAAVIPAFIARLRAYPPAGGMRIFLSKQLKRAILVPVGCLVLAAYGTEATTKLVSVLHTPPDQDLEAVYLFLETLPKDTLVAAHPYDADNIPLRSRRSVLASMETSLPLYVGYYQTMAERIAAVLAAYHASDFAAVDLLYDRYGVDVFVVNQGRYVPGASLYYEPFLDSVREQWRQGRRAGFVLRDPPAERILFQRGVFTIVRVGPPSLHSVEDTRVGGVDAEDRKFPTGRRRGIVHDRREDREA